MAPSKEYQQKRADRGRCIARATLLLLLFVVPLAYFGCGQQFELPPIPPPIPPAEPGYNYKTIWHLPSPTDLALHGPHAYVIEEKSRVSTYYSEHSSPDEVDLVNHFSNLIKPVRIAIGYSRDSTFVVVADSGDMKIKIFHFLGGYPLYSFTDTLWSDFSGLTADKDLNIYISDSQRNLVDQYDRWGERSHNISKYGTGSGYVIYPHGIDALLSPGNRVVLLIADTGKNWTQRLFASESYTPAVLTPIGIDPDEVLLSPLDVAASSDGNYIFIADTGHSSVLKFSFAGAFRDTVYSPTMPKMIEKVVPPVIFPKFIAAVGPLVMISEEEANRIVIVKYVSN